MQERRVFVTSLGPALEIVVYSKDTNNSNRNNNGNNNDSNNGNTNLRNEIN